MGPDRHHFGFWLTIAGCLVALPLLVLVLIGVGDRGEGTASSIVVPVAAPQSVSPTAEIGALPGADRATSTASRPDAESEATLPAGNRGPVPDRPIVSIIAGRSTVIRDSPSGKVVAPIGDTTEFGSPTVFSVRRVRGEWLGVSTTALPNGELGWIKADPAVMTGSYTDLRIVVDLSNHRARLLQGRKLLRSWTVTVGAPGSETPTGRFSVTDLFQGGLNPAYGCCAVALSATQPNLPSGWAGGNLIAIHGTDEPLGLDASHGCVRSADRDVRALVQRVPLGTPVTIRS